MGRSLRYLKGKLRKEFIGGYSEGRKRKLEEEAKRLEKEADPNYKEIECAGDPPAWAQTRGDLCQTIRWFNSWEGSARTHEGFGYTGILIDKNSLCSFMDEEVVILRIPGGYVLQGREFVLKESQTEESKYVKAAMVTQRRGGPVGIVIGDQNVVLEAKMPHRYNVMDFFMITSGWYERSGDYAAYTIRLQKLDLRKKSWWAEKGSPDPPSYWQRDFATRPDSQKCAKCGKESYRIYKIGWMCCHGECPDFWTINGSKAAIDQEYHDDFLSYRVHYAVADCLTKAEHSLIEPVPTITPENQLSYLYGDLAAKGIVCPQCCRCVPRVFFRGWKCEVEHLVPPANRDNEKGCPWSLTLSPRAVEFADSSPDLAPRVRNKMLNEFNTVYSEYKYDINCHIPTEDNISVLPYHKYTYQLSHAGTFTHLVSNADINGRANGPDLLFKSLQENDIGLRKHRMDHCFVKGTMTNNFLANFGLPYKFAAPNDSKPFTEAHPDLLHAFARLDWSIRHVCAASGGQYKKANELLVIGYITSMRLNYHHDGNGGLGPSIATLSLGAKTEMWIRMKDIYYTGVKLSGEPLDDDPVLDGCINFEERKKLKNQYVNKEISKKEYDAERRKLPNPYKGKFKAREPPVLIRIPLLHGHIVIMDGVDIQKYYEHSVKAVKGVRFAVTARYVNPLSVMGHDPAMGECNLTDEHTYNGQ